MNWGVVLLIVCLVSGICAFSYVQGQNSVDTTHENTVRVVTIIDTVSVSNTRYIPRIIIVKDTLNTGTPVNKEIAILDTVIVSPRYNVSTQVKYHYPDRYFEFYQDIVIKTDTVYVNVDRLNTVYKKRYNYSLVAPAIAVGLVAGILLVR